MSESKGLKMSLDRIRGMMLGAAIGDSLGIAYEFSFNTNKLDTYNGLIKETGETRDRYRSIVSYYPPGSVSDDTEMLITLARSLIAKNGYDRDSVILSYLEWANSGISMMGKNTRALFKGVKTVRGYESRMGKIDEKDKVNMLSNGAIMRCAPLALLLNPDVIATDCFITNPNAICRDAEIVHLSAVAMALLGFPVEDIRKHVRILAQTPKVKSILQLVDEGKEPQTLTGKTKGYVLNPLFFSMNALNRGGTFEDNIDFVIKRKNTDTDTNACVSGALLGALIGYDAMMKERRTAYNANMVLSVDRSGKTKYEYIGEKMMGWTYEMVIRPEKHTLHDFDSLCQGLYKLTPSK